MKKVLKFGGIALGAILLALFVLHLAGPKEYKVSRSVTINADRAAVWNKVGTLKGIDEWSPWNERDPNAKYTYSGTDGQVGAVVGWKGNEEVGVGEQEITAVDPMNSITTALRFKEPQQDEAIARILLADAATSTEVTWTLEGKFPFPATILFLLFMDMDELIGPDYEKGLGYLKVLVEGA